MYIGAVVVSQYIILVYFDSRRLALRTELDQIDHCKTKSRIAKGPMPLKSNPILPLANQITGTSQGEKIDTEEFACCC